MPHLLEYVLLRFSSLDKQRYLPTIFPWTRKGNQSAWVLAQKFYQDMCHHEVPIERIKGRNSYSDKICITIALLGYTRWSEQEMASRLVHHRDSTKHQYKLFSAGLQHVWTVPIG